MKIQNHSKRPLRSPRGFTLVELLLVLVILGTLAAIVIPKFSGRTEQAREAAARTDIANISSALNAYEVDVGSYPRGKDGLLALIEEPRDAVGWHGPYLQKNELPMDPWKNFYIYEYPGQHNPASFDLYSMGPDLKEGGDDDIVNWSTQ